jgi:hypothetical protein
MPEFIIIIIIIIIISIIIIIIIIIREFCCCTKVTCQLKCSPLLTAEFPDDGDALRRRNRKEILDTIKH